jgi:hypothetical protein
MVSPYLPYRYFAYIAFCVLYRFFVLPPFCFASFIAFVLSLAWLERVRACVLRGLREVFAVFVFVLLIDCCLYPCIGSCFRRCWLEYWIAASIFWRVTPHL